jgi:hypothetical protein
VPRFRLGPSAAPRGVDRVRALQRVLYRCAKQDRDRRFHAPMTRSPAATLWKARGEVLSPRWNGETHGCVCQSVNDVGEPCAGEPHARFDAAAGGNPGQSAKSVRPRKPPADPTRGEGAPRGGVGLS